VYDVGEDDDRHLRAVASASHSSARGPIAAAAQLIVVTAYPRFLTQSRRLRPGDVALTGTATALMLFGLYLSSAEWVNRNLDRSRRGRAWPSTTLARAGSGESGRSPDQSPARRP